MTKKIAILGGTSHIAKGLIHHLTRLGYPLHLFCRSKIRMTDFLHRIERNGVQGVRETLTIEEGFSQLHQRDIDVLINCVGVGTLDDRKDEYRKWFTITEKFDNLCLGYLQDVNKNGVYISFSSGAVYGRECSEPARKETRNSIAVNEIASDQYYPIARLNAEAKHRSHHDLNVVDLRVFNYFSRFVDLSENYFMIDVVNSIKDDTVLQTSDLDIVRDYVHPEDLARLIARVMETNRLNKAFDVRSRAPVSKMEVLSLFSEKYGLQYHISKSNHIISGTGVKNVYCSAYENASELDFEPEYTSIATLSTETDHLLAEIRGEQ